MTPLEHDAVERVFDGMQRDLDQRKADIVIDWMRERRSGLIPTTRRLANCLWL